MPILLVIFLFVPTFLIIYFFAKKLFLHKFKTLKSSSIFKKYYLRFFALPVLILVFGDVLFGPVIYLSLCKFDGGFSGQTFPIGEGLALTKTESLACDSFCEAILKTGMIGFVEKSTDFEKTPEISQRLREQQTEALQGLVFRYEIFPAEAEICKNQIIQNMKSYNRPIAGAFPTGEFCIVKDESFESKAKFEISPREKTNWIFPLDNLTTLTTSINLKATNEIYSQFKLYVLGSNRITKKFNLSGWSAPVSQCGQDKIYLNPGPLFSGQES